MKLNIPLLVITIVLGLGVLASYIPMIMDIRKNNNSKLYWGLDKQQRIPYYIFMILAVFGFLTFIVYYLDKNNKPKSGILSKGYSLEILIGLVLVFSILWSVFVYYSVKNGKNSFRILTVLTLAVVAISSLLLLAGTTMDKDSPPYVIAGILLFCLVTVLGDAVGWNARFLAD